MINLGAGFVLGILASYIGNHFWEKHKKKIRGSHPFVSVTITEDQILFEGQTTHSKTRQDALLDTFKDTVPPQE